MARYVPPKTLRKWATDDPGSELYLVAILDDQTVLSASGRYAQGSGSATCAWDAFLAGKMNEIVATTMGDEILAEVRMELTRLLDAPNQSSDSAP